MSLINREDAIDIKRKATVDANPEHFKAHQKFIQFMRDAEISSFGKWQWANGFNAALTAIGLDLENLPSVQPQPCYDAVSRADVLETYADLYDVFEDSKAICKELHKVYDRINALPAVQPQRKMDEWCTDCKEYDSEKHCCPRFNRVIRQTLSEQTEIIRCKDCKHADDDGVCQNSVGLVIQDDDDFCSRAERRTE